MSTRVCLYFPAPRNHILACKLVISRPRARFSTNITQARGMTTVRDAYQQWASTWSILDSDQRNPWTVRKNQADESDDIFLLTFNNYPIGYLKRTNKTEQAGYNKVSNELGAVIDTEFFVFERIQYDPKRRGLRQNDEELLILFYDYQQSKEHLLYLDSKRYAKRMSTVEEYEQFCCGHVLSAALRYAFTPSDILKLVNRWIWDFNEVSSDSLSTVLRSFKQRTGLSVVVNDWFSIVPQSLLPEICRGLGVQFQYSVEDKMWIPETPADKENVVAMNAYVANITLARTQAQRIVF